MLMISVSEFRPMLVLGLQGAADVHRPALSGLDLVEETLDIGHYGGGRISSKHILKMLARQGILFLVEKCPGELESHPYKARMVDQNGMQGCNGFIQQGFPLLL